MTLDQLLLFVLLGFGPGALIAGIALALVVNFRGSGIINIGAGALALVGAYVFFGLRTGGYLFLAQLDLGGPLGTLPAFVLTMAVSAAVGAVFDLLVLRKLRHAAPLAKLVAGLGLLLIVQAAVVLRFGGNGQGAPPVLPGGHSVHLFGVNVPGDRFMLTGIVLAATAALAAVYRWTAFGLATRAAAENEVVAVYAGLAPQRLSLVNGVLASVIAGALGVVVAPLTQLDPVTIPAAVVPALGAALLARFTSFGVAAVAGILLGSISSVLLYLQTRSWFPRSGGVTLPGVTELVYFAIIVAVMFWRGARLPERGALVDRRLPAAPAARRRAVPAAVLGAAGILAFATFPYDFRQALTVSLIGALVCLSFVVITGFVGQISLVQLALAGVGGYAVSKLAAHAEIGFPLGPLLGALVATLFGLVAAASALRVRGVNLAIVTLAAAVALESFVFDNTSWGGGVNGSPTAPPRLFGLDLGPDATYGWTDGKLPSPVFGFLCVVVVLVLGVFVASLRRSVLGRQMLAVRSNERAAAAAGISVRDVKLTAFGISSFIAGTAGSLYAYAYGSVTASQYGVLAGLAFVAFAYLGGITTVTGALLGGFIVTDGLLIHAVERWTGLPSNWELVFGGVALILTVITSPEGIAGAALSAFRRRPPVAPAVRAPAPRPQAKRAPRSGTVLHAAAISVRYGGVVALREVDLEVEAGTVVGLIGPNGAGKTTFIDAIAGFAPATGRVELDGRDISRLAPDRRARAGLARTWQAAELFDDLTVRENLAVTAGRPSLRRVAAELVTGRAADAASVEEALALLELSGLADALPDELTQGQRKLVGVARALASDPHLICLDEPAAGLDTAESDVLGRHLRQIVDGGPAMLLVDHDMGLVLGVCDHVVVLDFGKVIARGTPEEVRRHPAVVAAYLGSAAAEVMPAPAEAP